MTRGVARQHAVDAAVAFVREVVAQMDGAAIAATYPATASLPPSEQEYIAQLIDTATIALVTTWEE